MRVLISGLTAVGKTTHSRILARDLGIPVVEATPIVLRYSQQPIEESPWFASLDEIESRRNQDETIDDRVDRELLELCQRMPAGVFDTWGLPWLFQGEGLRIALTSSHEAASRKVYVSQGEIPFFDMAGCRNHMDSKNHSSVERFSRRSSVDLLDYDSFDVVLDTSCLIPSPTREDALKGIRSLAPVVAAIAACYGTSSSISRSALRSELARLEAVGLGCRMKRPLRISFGDIHLSYPGNLVSRP